MVGNGPGNCLANPPRRVGAELIAAAILIFVDGTHQASVAFLNDVQEAQAAVAVLLCDRHHQPQVAAGQISLGLSSFRIDGLDGPQTLVELPRRLQDQLLQADQLHLHRGNIFLGVLHVGPAAMIASN